MDFLNRPIPKSFRTSSAGWEEFLNKLQANIIKHHNRTHAWFVFIQFKKPDQAEVIKKWISDFSDYITTAYQQLTIPPKKNSPKEMLCSCLISREGLSFLNIQNAAIQFPKFEYSEVYRISEDEQKTEGFFTSSSHLLILLAHESEHEPEEELQAFIDEKIFNVLDRKGIEYPPPLIEKGALKRDHNHKAFEAFGFRDGISQPEVLREKIEAYKTDKWNPAATLGLTFFDMKTMGVEDYGSFAVYLKIEQHKEVFDDNVKKIAGSIEDVLDADQKIKLAEAYLMGRFKDGTPVINANKQGGENQDLNNFNYGAPYSYYALAQNKCPLFAHIFKSNPRDKPDIRIFRRGIPFQVANGLHFLAYQRSIEEQFMKIYEEWMGHRRHPAPNSDFGRDPMMMTDRIDGNVGNPSRSRKPIPKRWGEGDRDDSDDYFDMKDFDLPKPTTVRGAVFYFVPSLYFLKNIQNL